MNIYPTILRILTGALLCLLPACSSSEFSPTQTFKQSDASRKSPGSKLNTRGSSEDGRLETDGDTKTLSDGEDGDGGGGGGGKDSASEDIDQGGSGSTGDDLSQGGDGDFDETLEIEVDGSEGLSTEDGEITEEDLYNCPATNETISAEGWAPERGINFKNRCWYIAPLNVSCNSRCEEKNAKFDTDVTNSIAEDVENLQACREVYEAFEDMANEADTANYFYTVKIPQRANYGKLGCYFSSMPLTSAFDPNFGKAVMVGTGAAVDGDATGHPRACACRRK